MTSATARFRAFERPGTRLEDGAQRQNARRNSAESRRRVVRAVVVDDDDLPVDVRREHRSRAERSSVAAEQAGAVPRADGDINPHGALRSHAGGRLVAVYGAKGLARAVSLGPVRAEPHAGRASRPRVSGTTGSSRSCCR